MLAEFFSVFPHSQTLYQIKSMQKEITHKAKGHEKKCHYWSKSSLETHTTLLFLSNCDLHNKKTILLGKQKFHETFVCHILMDSLKLNTINIGLYLKGSARINKLC